MNPPPANGFVLTTNVFWRQRQQQLSWLGRWDKRELKSLYPVASVTVTHDSRLVLYLLLASLPSITLSTSCLPTYSYSTSPYQQQHIMSTRVYVGKLSPDVRRADIEDLFRDYGVSLPPFLRTRLMRVFLTHSRLGTSLSSLPLSPSSYSASTMFASWARLALSSSSTPVTLKMPSRTLMAKTLWASES